MPNLGDMVVRVVGDNSDLDKAIDKSEKKFSDFATKLSKVGKKLTTFVTLPLVGLGIAAVKSSADIEMQTAAFETMLGSAEAAGEMIDDLKKMAAKTPFQMTDLANASKTLLGFGVTAEKILPTIRRIGDVSQGNSQRFQQLSLAFAQVQAAGRLMGQDLLQMINAGFNPLQTIAEMTGRSMATLKGEMEKGAISAEMVADAFAVATEKGGRFFGGMERAAETLSGKWSTLMDDLAGLGRSFADILLPIIKNIIASLSDWIKRFTALDEGTKRFILAILGITAVVGPLTLFIGKLIPVVIALNAAILANPAVAIAAGVTILTTGLLALAVAMSKARAAQQGLNDEFAKGKPLIFEIDPGAQSEALIKRLAELNAQIKTLQANIAKGDETGKWAAALRSAESEAAQLTGRLEQLKEATKEVAAAGAVLTPRQKSVAEAHANVANALALIAQQQKLAAVSGEEYDAAAERRKVLLGEIDKLIKEGFTIEGGGIQYLLSEYADLLDAYDDQIAALEELEQTKKDVEALVEDFIANRERQIEVNRRLAETEAANAKTRMGFYRKQYDAVGQAIIAINEEKFAYIDAGVAVAEAEAWAQSEIKKVRDAEHDAEMARIKEEHDERIQTAQEIVMALSGFARQLTTNRIAELERLADAQEKANLAELKRMDATLAAQITALDKDLAAELERAGVAEATREEKLKAEIEAARLKGDAEKVAELEATLKREAIIADFETRKEKLIKDAEDARATRQIELDEQVAASRREIAHKEAIANKAYALFDIAINTAVAVTKVMPNLLKMGLTLAYGLAQAAAVVAKPLPELAEGGIAMPQSGGIQATIAERGMPEVIFPLDRLEEFLARRPAWAEDIDGGDLGDIRLQVNLDSRPILDKIFPATRNRTVLIDASAVV